MLVNIGLFFMTVILTVETHNHATADKKRRLSLVGKCKTEYIIYKCELLATSYSEKVYF